MRPAPSHSSISSKPRCFNSDRRRESPSSDFFDDKGRPAFSR